MSFPTWGLLWERFPVTLQRTFQFWIRGRSFLVQTVSFCPAALELLGGTCGTQRMF